MRIVELVVRTAISSENSLKIGENFRSDSDNPPPAFVVQVLARSQDEGRASEEPRAVTASSPLCHSLLAVATALPSTTVGRDWSASPLGLAPLVSATSSRPVRLGE